MSAGSVLELRTTSDLEMGGSKVILNSEGYQVLGQEFLTLRLVRLKSNEEWLSKRDGLFLLFPKTGTGKCVAGSKTLRLVPGDVFVLGEGDGRDKLSVSSGTEIVFWCFSLRLEHLYPLFAGNEISLLEAVVEELKSPKLFPASTALAKQCHRLIEDMPPHLNLDHRSQLLRVAAAVLSEEFKMAQHRRIGVQGIEEHTIQVFESLSGDELVGLSVGELAAKFGCSRRHLNRLFHHYFGYSVAALKMEMRLLKAVSLLRDRNMKVIHVAERCGFNHLGLFNTCFKRRFSVSPGQWRKQAASDDHPPARLASTHTECPLHPKGLCPWTGRAEYFHPVATNAPSFPKSEKKDPVRSLPLPNPQMEQRVIPLPHKKTGELHAPDRSQAQG